MAEYVISGWVGPYYGNTPLANTYFSFQDHDILTVKSWQIGILYQAPLVSLMGWNTINIACDLNCYQGLAIDPNDTTGYNTINILDGSTVTVGKAINLKTWGNQIIVKSGGILTAAVYSDTAVILNDGNFLTNSGIILGGDKAVVMAGNGFLNNYGLLVSDNGTAIEATGQNSSLHNYASGTIQAQTGTAVHNTGDFFGLNSDGNIKAALDGIVSTGKGASIAVTNVTAGRTAVSVDFTDFANIAVLGGAKIEGETGFLINGNDAMVDNFGTISSSNMKLGVIINGNDYHLTNKTSGTIQAETAIILNGNGGSFLNESDNSQIQGLKNALIVNGRGNTITSHGLMSSSEGIAVTVDGFGNTLNLSKIEGSEHALVIDGSANTVHIDSIGLLHSLSDAMVIDGDLNIIEMGAAGSDNIVQSEQGAAISVEGDDTNLTLTNVSGLTSALEIEGGHTVLTLNGNVRGNEAVKIFGTNTTVNANGVIQGEDIGLWIGGNNYKVSVSSLGEQTNITGKTGVELQGNGGEFLTYGRILADYTGLSMDGDNNNFFMNHGGIQAQNTAMDVLGSGNTITLDATSLISTSIGMHISGTQYTNYISVSNSLIQAYNKSAPSQAFYIEGIGVDLSLLASIVSTSSLGTDIQVSADQFKLEMAGSALVSASNGIALIGNQATIEGSSDSAISVDRTAILLEGSKEKIEFKGGIRSGRIGISAKGNESKFDVWDIYAPGIGISVGGNHNNIQFHGKISAGQGLALLGDNNIVVNLKDATLDAGSAIFVHGIANDIDNQGTVKGLISILGEGNSIENEGSLDEIFIQSDSTLVFTNARAFGDDPGGEVTNGINGENIKYAKIYNEGLMHSVGTVIQLSIDSVSPFEPPLNETHIENSKTGTIRTDSGQSSTFGIAIDIENGIASSVTNDGKIIGSVLLSGNSMLVNQGSIEGRHIEKLDGQDVVVAVSLGNGTQTTYLCDTGKVTGEIWGGSNADRIGDSAEGDTVRTFGGKDEIDLGAHGHIYAGSGDDAMSGHGQCYIDAGEDNDLIWSYDGQNTLIGGTGNDTFGIAHASGDEKADIIRDFGNGSDKILLDQDYFPISNDKGKIDPSAFAYTDGIISPLTRLVYDRSAGNLYYTSHGDLSEALQNKIAHFDGLPYLTVENIEISGVVDIFSKDFLALLNKYMPSHVSHDLHI